MGTDSQFTIGSYTYISGCELSETPYIDVSHAWKIMTIAGVKDGVASHWNTIENCTLYNSGWNNIQLYGNRNPPNGSGIPSTHITVRNNKIYNSYYHGGIDLFGNLDYVTIYGNEYYNSPTCFIYTHDKDIFNYIMISSNNVHDITYIGISLGSQSCPVNNSIILNNTFKNFTDPAQPYPLYLENCYNQIVGYNKFYNTGSSRLNAGMDTVVFDRNYIHTDAGNYMVVYGSKNLIIRNPSGKKTVTINQNIPKVTLEFDDNTVFIPIPNPQYSVFTPVKYYPDGSRCSIEQTAGMGAGSINPVTTYLMTAKPTSASATVIVNKFDISLPKGNILVDFTADTNNGNNIDFVIGDLGADTNYQVTRAGANYHVVKSNANKCIKFSNSEWSEKNFTITETDAPADITTSPDVNIGQPSLPPLTAPSSPQNLAVSAGNSQVSLSWQAPASDGGSAITNYKIYRGNTTGGETLLATIGTSLSYLDTVVSSGLTYYYQVSVVNSIGESSKSNEVTVTPTVSTEISSKIKVYPNPYLKGKSSASKITFANLPGEATIRIYDSGGRLVKELVIRDAG